MNCDVCQTPNDDQARFCRRCGTELPRPSAPLPPPAAGAADPLWAATRGTDPNGQNWETLVPTERAPGPTASPLPATPGDTLPTATDLAAVRAADFATVQQDLRVSVAAELAERRRRRRIAVAIGSVLAVLAAAIVVVVVLAADDGGSTASTDSTALLETSTTVTGTTAAPATTFATATTLPTAATLPATTAVTTTTVAATTTVAPTTLPAVVVPSSGAPATTVAPSTSAAAPTTTTAAPATTAPVTTAPATTAPATTAPATTAPIPANGDLGLTRPITKPACDGRYITLLGSSVDPDGYRIQVGNLLQKYPQAEYLRTELVCSSLRAKSAGGDAIYVVYLGPFSSKQQACNARSQATGAYVKVLDNTSDPAVGVDCG